MSQRTIKRITISMVLLLAAALFEFCALFVQVNQAVSHSRTGTIAGQTSADRR